MGCVRSDNIRIWLEGDQGERITLTRTAKDRLYLQIVAFSDYNLKHGCVVLAGDCAEALEKWLNVTKPKEKEMTVKLTVEDAKQGKYNIIEAERMPSGNIRLRIKYTNPPGNKGLSQFLSILLEPKSAVKLENWLTGAIGDIDDMQDEDEDEDESESDSDEDEEDVQVTEVRRLRRENEDLKKRNRALKDLEGSIEEVCSPPVGDAVLVQRLIVANQIVMGISSDGEDKDICEIAKKYIKAQLTIPATITK